MLLIRKLNYRMIQLDDDNIGLEQIGYLKGEEYRYVRWGGFIKREQAKLLHEAKPVRLEISAYYKSEELRSERFDLSPGQHIHGCLSSNVAFALYDQDGPRLVSA